MPEIKEYTAYGISTLLVLSSVVLYFVLSKKPETIEDKLKAQLNQYTKDFNEYLKQIELYYTKKFDKEEDIKYHANYYQEELLKLLIKLDGIDLTIIEKEENKANLKLQRKSLIKQIQLKQKELDTYLKNL